MIKGMKAGRGGEEEEGEEEQQEEGRTESGNFSFARRNVKAANEQASALRSRGGKAPAAYTCD